MGKQNQARSGASSYRCRALISEGGGRLLAILVLAVLVGSYPTLKDYQAGLAWTVFNLTHDGCCRVKGAELLTG